LYTATHSGFKRYLFQQICPGISLEGGESDMEGVIVRESGRLTGPTIHEEMRASEEVE